MPRLKPLASFQQFMLIQEIWEARGGRYCVPVVHFRPPADVVIADETARIRLELAGVREADVDISVSGNAVRVSGHRASPQHDERHGALGYQCAEIRFGAFERVVELPWPVDPARLRIVHRDGLLTLDLARARASAGSTTRSAASGSLSDE